jgi:uncharacterized protein (DUF2147 family)
MKQLNGQLSANLILPSSRLIHGLVCVNLLHNLTGYRQLTAPTRVQMLTTTKLLATPLFQMWRIVAPGVLLAMLLVAAPNPGQAAPPEPVAGVWFDDTGDGAVEIGPCGDKLCGRIVWLKSPNDKNGRPLVDGYNPEAGQSKRPICGLPVIGDLKRQRDGSWDAGWIYDPKQGKSFDLEVRAKSADQIQIKGYVGMKFLSETFIWSRAPANLPRCK